MEPNIINNPTTSNKNNTIYTILSAVFILLIIAAVYLFIKIKSSNKNTVIDQTKTEVTKIISSSPVASDSSESIQVLKKFDNSDFKAEYYSDMELVDSALESGKKYSFVNDEITYQIYIGTDWMEENPLRNFDNKEDSINNIPSYNYTDASSYIGFDFVSPSQKYITIKCIYDVNNQNLINNCTDLVNSFYLYNP